MPNNERVSFEAWHARTFPDESLSRWDTYPHRYIDPQVQHAWRAWKAQDKRHKALIKAAQALTESIYLANLELHIDTLKTELAKLKETP